MLWLGTSKTQEIDLNAVILRLQTLETALETLRTDFKAVNARYNSIIEEQEMYIKQIRDRLEKRLIAYEQREAKDSYTRRILKLPR